MIDKARIQIRRAIRADWPDIAALHRRAVRHERRHGDGEAPADIRAMEHSFRGELWVAVRGGAILGFVACARSEILWLYVDPRLFRAGVGRSLLRHAIDRCGPVAHARVLSENRAIIELCASEGFAEVGEEIADAGLATGPLPMRLLRRVALVPGEEPISAEPRPLAPVPARSGR